MGGQLPHLRILLFEVNRVGLADEAGNEDGNRGQNNDRQGKGPVQIEHEEEGDEDLDDPFEQSPGSGDEPGLDVFDVVRQAKKQIAVGVGIQIGKRHRIEGIEEGIPHVLNDFLPGFGEGVIEDVAKQGTHDQKPQNQKQIGRYLFRREPFLLHEVNGFASDEGDGHFGRNGEKGENKGKPQKRSAAFQIGLQQSQINGFLFHFVFTCVS